MPHRVLLCVDVSHYSYLACATNKHLTSGDTFTGGLYGFMMLLGKAVRETQATNVAFCLDTPPYRRSLEYPEYKMLRKKTQDDDLRQLHMDTKELLCNVLASIGCRVWWVQGFESDDLIAHAVRQYACRYDRIYAASNDSDLYQLLQCDNFAIYKGDAKGPVTRTRLLRETGLTPDQFMLATALSGTHNDIEGIASIGEVRSRNAVLDPALLRGLRDQHGAMIDRNLHLIKLPHPDFPPDVRMPVHEAGFRFRNLYRALGFYDITTTSTMVDAFEAFMPV